jgi:hypothetical protein
MRPKLTSMALLAACVMTIMGCVSPMISRDSINLTKREFEREHKYGEGKFEESVARALDVFKTTHPKPLDERISAALAELLKRHEDGKERNPIKSIIVSKAEKPAVTISWYSDTHPPTTEAVLQSARMDITRCLRILSETGVECESVAFMGLVERRQRGNPPVDSLWLKAFYLREDISDIMWDEVRISTVLEMAAKRSIDAAALQQSLVFTD